MSEMKVSPTGIKMIQRFEGCILHPYRCPAGVPTIGFGNTFYPNGKKVTMKDSPITLERANELFLFVLSFFEKDVNSLVKTVLKPFQFDSLVSFAYNVGSDIDADDIPEGLGDSTLLKKVNANPNDPAIVNEFLKWNKCNGKVNDALIKRRTTEAHYYMTGSIIFK
jgi:lysozyme